MSELKVLIEEVISKPGRVDADAGILYDCLLLGGSSRNGTDYPMETREKAIHIFEGAKVNLSHSAQRDAKSLLASVPWDRRIGRAFDVHNAPDGLRGNVKVLKKHPFTPTLFESAEEMPDMFGFSPIMVGMCRKDGTGREVCGEIKRVKSIDLVTDPGTTRSLFEDFDMSKEMEKLLREEETPEEVAETETEEQTEEQKVEDLDPEAGKALALFHAVLAEVEDFLNKEGGHEEHAKRIGEHLKHHAKMHHKQEEAPAEESKEEEAPAETPAEEKEEEYDWNKWDLSRPPSTPSKVKTKVIAEEERPRVQVKKPKSGYTGNLNSSSEKDWNKFLRGA